MGGLTLTGCQVHTEAILSLTSLTAQGRQRSRIKIWTGEITHQSSPHHGQRSLTSSWAKQPPLGEINVIYCQLNQNREINQIEKKKNQTPSPNPSLLPRLNFALIFFYLFPTVLPMDWECGLKSGHPPSSLLLLLSQRRTPDIRPLPQHMVPPTGNNTPETSPA